MEAESQRPEPTHAVITDSPVTPLEAWVTTPTPETVAVPSALQVMGPPSSHGLTTAESASDCPGPNEATEGTIRRKAPASRRAPASTPASVVVVVPPSPGPQTPPSQTSLAPHAPQVAPFAPQAAVSVPSRQTLP